MNSSSAPETQINLLTNLTPFILAKAGKDFIPLSLKGEGE